MHLLLSAHPMMAILLVSGPNKVPLLAVVFGLAGVVVGVEEALEDSLAAELVPPTQHGIGFGTLAAVNAVGDFVSSAAIGLLWSALFSIHCLRNLWCFVSAGRRADPQNSLNSSLPLKLHFRRSPVRTKRDHRKRDFRNSLLPAGPVIRRTSGPSFGSASNSNVRNGQHSRSAEINSAMTARDFESPGSWKLYPFCRSSILRARDLNWATSVASRCRSSSDERQHTIGCSSDISLGVVCCSANYLFWLSATRQRRSANNGPNGFDYSKRPSALEKAVTRSKSTCECECQNEPLAPLLQCIEHQHGCNRDQSKDVKSIHSAK